MRTTLASAALAWTALIGCAQAAPKVIDPDWVRKPTIDEIDWAYPQAAAKAGLPGKAVITCSVNANGEPVACTVDSESPAGMGFGESAVALRKYMKFRPKTIDGKYAPGEVTIPITFEPREPASPLDIPTVLTARQVALARRVVEALGLEASSFNLLDSAMRNYLFYSDTALDAEERLAVAQATREAVTVVRPKIFAAVASDLFRGMSEAEMERVAAFFETPEGRTIGRRMYGQEAQDRRAFGALGMHMTRIARDRMCSRSASLCVKIDARAGAQMSPK